jgi:hypothetical protein
MAETFYNPKLHPSVEAIIKPYEHYQNYKMFSVDMVKPPPERQD